MVINNFTLTGDSKLILGKMNTNYSAHTVNLSKFSELERNNMSAFLLTVSKCIDNPEINNNEAILECLENNNENTQYNADDDWNRKLDQAIWLSDFFAWWDGLWN
jgi:hypothetical protein